MTNKRRIRKLNVYPYSSGYDGKAKTISLQLWILIVSSVLIILALGTKRIRDDLNVHYTNHYNSLVHGKNDYCEQHLDVELIMEQLTERVIGQQNAINRLKRIILNHQNLTSIALIGTSGIGKTLTTNVIQSHFHWNENIQLITWLDYHETMKKADVNYFRNVMRSLSHCGQNLVIIDDIPESEINFIQKINIRFRKYVLNDSKIKLLIFYVIRVQSSNNSQLDNPDQEGDFQFDETISMIHYRKFNKNDLIECIKTESKLINTPLNDNEINDIIKYINVDKFGCKNVHSKIVITVSDTFS